MHIGINAHLLAFTGNYRQAGLSRYIYELLTQLPPQRPQARFTALAGNAPIPPDFPAPPNLAFSHSRLPTVRAPIRIAWEQTLLPLAAARLGLDLLFCPVNVRPMLSPCPTVVTIHDLIFLRYPRAFHPLKRLYLTAMTGWSARHARHVIAVSEATRRDVLDLLHVPPGHVTTVHNGVSPQFRPLPEADKATFRRDKGAPGRIIIYVGTLEPRKNLTTLLHAFAALSRDPDLSDVTLVIGGSKGWYYDEIFATAERLGLGPWEQGGRVRWLGRVPDAELPLWYNIAGVCAYPSFYEGFGLPALEAMSCGTPVVASNTSALPEVVGDAGILVEPKDTQAWADALRTLIRTPDLAANLSQAGMQRASTFTWERTARQTAQVLDEVISKDGRR
jgi:glycosyltransferase involved in cell wall biosynthesis